MRTIPEKIHETPVRGEFEVIVVGGGPAGIAASIAAARSGARTLLIERYGALGGLATMGLVGTFCGFFTTGPKKKEIVGGIAADLLGRLRARGGLSDKTTSKVNPAMATYRYHPEILKFAAEEAAVAARIELLYHTFLVDVVPGLSPQRLSGIIVENKSGRSAYLGKTIVDATGDGDVAFRAGVPNETGDEEGRSQALTTMFRLINVDLGRTNLGEIRDKLAKGRDSGKYAFSRTDAVIYAALPQGVVSVNLCSIPDLNGAETSDLSKAELEGRRQVFEYLRAFRDLIPGFENAEIDTLAPQVGVRETRRVLGEYLLGEEDVLAGTKFDDGIALGAWPVELHDPETRKIIWRSLNVEDDCYAIPSRCLIPRGADNLLVAGRCISATHIAQASTRVIGQAFAMGEAAGVMAARCADSHIPARDLNPAEIRRALIDNGAIIEV